MAPANSVLLLLLLAVLWAAGGSQAAFPEVIKIGALLTGDDDALAESALRYAVDRVNTDPVLLPDAKLSLQVERLDEHAGTLQAYRKGNNNSYSKMQPAKRPADRPSEIMYVVISLVVTLVIVAICMGSALMTRPKDLSPDTAIWILPPTAPPDSNTTNAAPRSLVDQEDIVDEEDLEEVDRHMWARTAG